MKKYFIAKSQKLPGLSSATFSDLYQYLADVNVVCLDLETSPQYEWMHYSLAGLDPHTSRVVMLQLGDDRVQYAIDVRLFSYDTIRELLLYLKNSKIKVIGQNFKFD